MGKGEDADDEQVGSTRKSSKANRGAHSRQIKTEKYDRSSCVETFLVKFDSCTNYNGWISDDKAAHLRASPLV